MKERVQKIIAKSGLASRRKAENMITDGRVRINGLVLKELGSLADPSRDIIEVDGSIISQPENKVYIILHKPPGYITSLKDPQNRPVIRSLLSIIPERIFPVGRLDYDTEGLLVMTNDGNFAQILQHPKNNIERRYLVKVKAIPSKAKIDKLQKGIYLDGIKTGKAKIKIIERTDRNSWLEVVIWQGRNRQIKQMFDAVGHRTLRIIRTDFGPLCLDNLKPGAFRFLTKKEIMEIINLAN